ncbi:MAG: hypothetical protein K6E29_05705 [Cyanobacteria bacterium RUI128]|nr:hypothetical protein [Cyanobacteria bacterium RUI128]
MAKHQNISFDRDDVIKAFEYIKEHGAPEGFRLKGKDYNVQYGKLEYSATALFKVIAGDRVVEIKKLKKLRAEFNQYDEFKIIPVNKNKVENNRTKINETKEELIDKNFYTQKAEEYLKKFIEYEEDYENNIGVYAIYLKDKNLIEKLSCKEHIKERFEGLNQKPNKIFNNLFYIGTTCKKEKSCFKERLINGHAQGKKKTSFNSNLLKGLGYSVETGKEFRNSKKEFLQNNKWTTWEDWFKEHFTYRIFPLDKKSSSEFVEELLIYAYQPPFNTDGCDKKPFK